MCSGCFKSNASFQTGSTFTLTKSVETNNIYLYPSTDIVGSMNDTQGNIIHETPPDIAQYCACKYYFTTLLLLLTVYQYPFTN